MAQAISQLHSSESSYFGAYLADLSGFDLPSPASTKKKTRKKAAVEKILERYQDELVSKADKSYEWKEFSDYLVVDKTESNQIVVFVDGSEEVQRRAALLEFGTPEKIANPLMRVAEAEFNEDFQRQRMFRL